MSESIVPPNRLRRRLADGGLAVGTMLVEVRQPGVMRLLANAGFDFVLIDSEHGPFTVETIADLSRAARDAGLTPVVRIPELTYFHVTQALDGGAQGIMLPRVTAADQVGACVRWMKYPPEGRRGAVLARGHTEFRAGPLPETLAALNRKSFLVVQIETAEAEKAPLTARGASRDRMRVEWDEDAVDWSRKSSIAAAPMRTSVSGTPSCLAVASAFGHSL